MSWKKAITAGLLCVLASPAFAAPTLSITGSINNQATIPVRVWNVAAGPDIALDPSTAMTLELGFQATGGNILSITSTPNESAAASPAPARVELNNQPGNVIFGWETLTDIDPTAVVNNKPVGIQIGTGGSANQGVAFIAENLFTTAGNRDLLTITTDSSVTSLTWGGIYKADHTMFTPNGTLQGSGRIAQSDTTGVGGATNFDTGYSGSLAKLGPTNQRFLGDMNGNGSVTSADVARFSDALFASATYKTNNPNLNYLRADMNGSGTVTTADVARFSNVLFSTNGVPSGSDGGLGAGGTVPEPASVALVGLGLMFASAIRRRSR